MTWLRATARLAHDHATRLNTCDGSFLAISCSARQTVNQRRHLDSLRESGSSINSRRTPSPAYTLTAPSQSTLLATMVTLQPLSSIPVTWSTMKVSDSTGNELQITTSRGVAAAFQERHPGPYWPERFV